MSQCPRCGAGLNPGMNFCGVCGTRVAGSHSTISFAPGFLEEEESSPGSSGAGGAALVELDQVEGTVGRRMHDIEDGSLTVGRSQHSGIVLDDVTVSRDHAEITGGGAYRIRDAGSLNGTYVNRVRVDSVDLRNGDEIQIGKYRFKFIVT